MLTPTKKLTLTAMFFALGVVLPFLTSQIKEIGDSLLPMHFVIMLCGAVCGPKYASICGGILPVFRSICFGMPPIYPSAVWMALELATYGFVIGIMYINVFKRNIKFLIPSLVVSMISGRIVWGITKAILLNVGGKPFTFAMFIAGGFADALPGIVIQLILIPVIIKFLDKAVKK